MLWLVINRGDTDMTKIAAKVFFQDFTYLALAIGAIWLCLAIS